MILRGSVYSKVLRMDTGLTVVAPDKGPGPYRAAYLLHGLCGNHESWSTYTMLPAFASRYGMLFAMPEVGRSFYLDGQHGPRAFTYVMDELPELVQRYFHVQSDPKQSALIGGSMGGYGALKCALMRPEQYGTCIAISPACLFLGEALEAAKAGAPSPYVDEFMGLLGPELELRPQDDLAFLAKRAADAALPRCCAREAELPGIYLSCGAEDPLLPECRRFQSLLEELGIPLRYEELAGGHDWPFFRRALERSLQACFGEGGE